MKSEQVIVLAPKDVVVGWRARRDLRNLDELASSIEEVGQMQPIVVTKNSEGLFELIGGHRRLEACKRLERGVKAVVIETTDPADALWKQLAENCQREDFTKLELGEGLKRHKELYEELHPEAKVGAGTGGKNKRTKKDFVKGKKSKPAERYATVAAKELGVSESIVYDSLRLATELDDRAKDSIRGIDDPKKRQRAEQEALQSIRKENRAKRLREKAEARKADRDATETESRLDHGDCREVMKRYAAQGLVFDAIITDPPYGLHWSKIEHSIRASVNDPPTWDDLDVGWVFDAAPLLADDATVFVFCPGEAIGTYQEAFYEVGLKYRGFLVWWKSNPAPVHRPGNYISACEAMVWATKGKPFFKDWDNAGAEDAHNAFRSPVCQGEERLAHETQKPEAVIERIVERHVQEGDFVLDPFMGVGTTIITCKRRGIPCAGIEKDRGFYDLAVARVQAG